MSTQNYCSLVCGVCLYVDVFTRCVRFVSILFTRQVIRTTDAETMSARRFYTGMDGLMVVYRQFFDAEHTSQQRRDLSPV